METKKQKIAVAVTGASGSIYTKVLLDKLTTLKEQCDEISIVMSDNAKAVWELELENKIYQDYDFNYYDKNNFMAPFASGSAKYDALIICPCSMGTLARISSGISNDLITRDIRLNLFQTFFIILINNSYI